MDVIINKIINNINSLKNFEDFIKRNKNDIVFLCVGNGDVWYDSFGPLIGELLKNYFNIKAFVYGDMTNCIKLSNLNKYIDYINIKHLEAKIIVLDAAITTGKNNNIVFKNGSTKCAYFSKDSNEVGDFSVLCPIKDNKEDDIFNFKQVVTNALVVTEIISKCFE